MEATINVKLKPFEVPLKVREDVTQKDAREFFLAELDESVLSQLCNEFTHEVFKSAGKQQPPRAG